MLQSKMEALSHPLFSSSQQEARLFLNIYKVDG